MGRIMDWLKPKPTELNHREWSEQLFLLFHHVDEAKKGGPDTETHLEQARVANNQIGMIKARFTGKITRSETRWTKGTKGIIGSSHPYTHTWDVEVTQRVCDVWFNIKEDFFGYSVIGYILYNNQVSTFDPKEVTIEHLS